MRKKAFIFIPIILILFLVLSFTGCGGSGAVEEAAEGEDSGLPEGFPEKTPI